ncbi:MAG TPA: gamma-glutamyltransferase, partial [Acidimicrobiales bacterium]
MPRPLAVMARQCTGIGPRGVVCAAAPLAAQAGAAVLRDGGNAYDAVVAMGLAESVLLPPKCGLGGDLVALAHGPDAPQGPDLPVDEPRALVAVGGAPR